MEAYCYCRGPDDGTAMIQCDICTGWFHLRCTGLSEDQAELMDSFACRNCIQKKKEELVAQNINLSSGPDPCEVKASRDK
eukprot:m.119511 g.119511  ORF g.119511 m.119511 type:complete len:80 (+) comp19544_c0_seq2:701-940(+)